MKFYCPCCDYNTLDEEPTGTFQICGICYWEDDPIQFVDDTYTDGANKISLNMARENFKRFGAVEEKFIELVKQPKKGVHLKRP